MFLVQFGLLAIIAILVKAAPQSIPYDYAEYPACDTSAQFPIPSYVQQPGKINGVSFFLILESGSNYHGDGANVTDDEHKDVNVIVGFFNGVGESTRNNLESIARNIQSALESNPNFKDGHLAELLRNSGLVEIKSLGEF